MFEGSKKGLIDTKKFRKCVLEKSNTRLGLQINTISEGSGAYLKNATGLINLLDSSYKTSVPSPLYAQQLEGVTLESGRFLCTVEEAINDLIFSTTRGEFFSQNIASFLFPGNRFSQTDSTDVLVRNFYLSIIKAYFGGSTKSNIEDSLEQFIGAPIGLIENYLTDRDLSRDTFDKFKQFTFQVLINADDPRIDDLNLAQKDTEFLLNIIKPAHTYFEANLIFEELLEVFQAGCELIVDEQGLPIVTPDGFETKAKLSPTSICATSHFDLYDYGYEDTRKQCQTKNLLYVENEDIANQAAPRYARSVIGGMWSSSDKSLYHTNKAPLMKETGELADSPSDVEVFVNGTQVTVLEIYALSGVVKLASIPNITDTVTINYWYGKGVTTTLNTNDLDTVLNNWNENSTEYPYKSVLWPAEDFTSDAPEPLQNNYTYKGFDLFYSSVLNCPETLLYNEFNLRNRLNDALPFNSLVLDTYHTTLGEDTSLIPKSLDKTDKWNRLNLQALALTKPCHKLTVKEDKILGEIHKTLYHPFFSALEIENTTNNGQEELVSSVCEQDTFSLDFDFSNSAAENLEKLKSYDHFHTNIHEANSEYVLNGENHGQVHIRIDDLQSETVTPVLEDMDTLDMNLFEKEYYQNPWFITNDTEANDTGEVLPGTRLDDGNIEVVYTYGYNPPFTLTEPSDLLTKQPPVLNVSTPFLTHIDIHPI